MPDKKYQVGAVKQHPDTKVIAVDTGHGGSWAWGVITTDNGGHYATDE
jgi:hypothetical protein